MWYGLAWSHHFTAKILRLILAETWILAVVIHGENWSWACVRRSGDLAHVCAGALLANLASHYAPLLSIQLAMLSEELQLRGYGSYCLTARCSLL